MGETDLVELTLQVAKEVMGCRVVHSRDGTYKLVVPGSYDRIDFVTAEGAWAACPKYPTDWSAAGEVLERMQAQDYDTRQAFIDYLEGFVAHEYKYVGEYPGTRYTPLFLTPLAICLAALAAVRATK